MPLSRGDVDLVAGAVHVARQNRPWDVGFWRKPVCLTIIGDVGGAWESSMDSDFCRKMEKLEAAPLKNDWKRTDCIQVGR